MVSCSSKPSVVIEDTSCNAPCWKGIEIGKTNIDQTMKLLSQMPEIDINSIGHNKVPITMEEFVGASFKGVKEANVIISFQNDKAISIDYRYRKDISLADAIKKFGEPQYIIPYSLRGDPSALIIVDFFYPEKGICLHHQNRSFILGLPETYRIKGSLNITEVYYVDSSIPNGQFEYGCLRGGDENEWKTMVQDWKGFGVYPLLRSR